MSRILLADDSPHAQRMGEVILREEGFEVVSVTDGETAILRLGDVDPDLILADAWMPSRSGYEICEYVKSSPRHRHTRVVLTAGAHETLDKAEVARVRADGVLQKPFEASVMLEMLAPLARSAESDRSARPPEPKPSPAALVDPDAGRVRAAVTVALDDAVNELVDKITERVLAALKSR